MGYNISLLLRKEYECMQSFIHQELRMADVAKLYELQRIDSTWTKVRNRLQQIRTLLAESGELKTVREQVAAIETEHHKWHADQTNAELESQALVERVRETEARLMSGEIRSPKELEALQASGEALKRLRTTVDGNGVEALLKTEETAVRLQQLREQLKSTEAKWQTGQSELLEEDAKMKRMFTQLKKQRESSAAALPVKEIERYEQMRQRKAGIAVAAVVQQCICSACHVKIPTGVMSNARVQSDMTFCPSCGRILYLG